MTGGPQAARANRWVILGLLFATAALNYADRTAFSAIFPLLKRDLGMSDVQLGALGSLFLWAYGLMSPLSGQAGDRCSRASLVTGSLLGWSLTTGLSGLVATMHQLYAARILLGFSEALYLPAAMALIAEHFTPAGRGRALSIHVMGMQLGFVLGGYLAGSIGDHSGWRASLFVLSAFGLVLAGLCHFFLRGGPVRLAPEAAAKPAPLPWRENFRHLLQVPSFHFLLLEAMITSISAWIFAYWLPLYYRETFHLSLAQAALYGTAALSAGAWVGIVAGGWLSDRVASAADGRRRMLVQLLCYGFSAPFLLSFVWSGSLGWITACVFAFGLLQSMGAANEAPLQFDVLPRSVWSGSVGLINTANCLTGGLGIYAAGFFKARLGLKWVFAGISGFSLLAAGLLLVCYLVFLGGDLRRARLLRS